MAKVTLVPMPTAYRDVPRRLRPQHPPIFDGPPTKADRELARALFLVLDDESKDWYAGDAIFADLLEETSDDT